MTALSSTDALLACAAATSRAEMHAARMALVQTGSGVLRDIDRTALAQGDGTAGRHLLAELGGVYVDSAAARSSRLQVRLYGQLARPEVTPW
ncbi:hypothetical protein [Actinotalea sp. JY-7876]|uniref:hypothetical protein n=1 Tax=Actinotalea sp. JY-7876 TaxID=2758442 RepID=UPI0015F463FE|nr:hypothetical protein [Actinotalea sp. JY-7876]